MVMAEDIEITFARRLGDVLNEMRATLSDTATKRVLLFILDRYGIQAAAVNVCKLPPDPTIPLKIKPVAPVAHANGTQPMDKTCPICGYHSSTQGLHSHMHHKHGTTIKEYERTKALDVQTEVTP